MGFKPRAYIADDARGPVWPFVVSVLGHLLLFGIILYQPGKSSQGTFLPSVIDVRMVEMPSGAPPSEKAVQAQTPVQPAKPPEEMAALPQSRMEAPQPEVSVAPKPKSALKYKTFKSQEVLKNALERLEQKVESSPPKPLEDTIRRLREQVAKEEKTAAAGRASEGTAGARTGGLGTGGGQEGEAVDLYTLEVAFTIQKNWAFSEQLAGGGNLVTEVTFKVMPNGKIEDIHIDSRSGNAYLDDSALKAIEKSSPVRPHPPGLNKSYVLIGLRFTPKGLK